MSDTLLPEVERVALRLYEGLNCPRSVTAAILLRYGEWDALSQLKASPDDYVDADAFFRAYQASDFLRKYPGLPLGVDTGEVAWKAWGEAEAQCYRTNERLSPYCEGITHPACDERILGFLREIRQEVTYLIGMSPPREIEGRFGPGATVTDPARQCTIPDKLSSSVSYTPDAVYWLVPWSGTSWAKAVCEDRSHQSLSSKSFRPVRGNIWFSVPKDATTDRSCGKEPGLNSFYQRGVGIQMGARLKQRGFDLRILPEAHQQMAKFGSLFGTVATIDLKSASDTIATNLVKLLLPSAWFEVLDSLRSKYTLRPTGGWQKLEKFSSMGNGFTFELETTLFLAIARVAVRHFYDGDDEQVQRVSVFGDDVLVPNDAATEVMSAFAFLGLTPNKRKTFTSGRFRESCGGDYFDGQNVRPYLLKEIPDEPQKLLGLANGLYRVGHRLGGFAGGGRSILSAWHNCVDTLPQSVRACRGPEALGDLCLHDAEHKWTTRERNSRRYIRVYRPINQPTVRWSGYGSATQMAASLYLAGSTVTPSFFESVDGSLRSHALSSRCMLDFRGRFTSRDSVSGYKVGWTCYS